MANKEVQITIKAIDQFSKVFNELDDNITKVGKASEKLAGAFDDFANASGSSKLKNLATTFAEIAVGMQTVQGRAGLAVRGVTELTKNFIKLYDASKKDFAEGLQKLWNVASIIGGVIGKVASGFVNLLQSVTGADLSFGGLASTVANFETNMARANVLTGASADGIEKLNNKAKTLAMDFGVSIEEISAGMVEMGSAGFDCGQVLSTIEPIMKMATSGCISFAESTEIVANGLNAFNMDKTTDDVTRFANTLAVVADKSATDISQLGEALKKVGPLAGMAGTEIEDVGALLGIMADNGIKASSAGTTLKNVMSRFASGNASVTKAIKDYNLAGFEQKMLVGDLSGAMVELCKETEKYNPVQKEAIATALAGAYGLPGLVAIMNKGAEGVAEYVEQIEEENRAREENLRLNTMTAEVLDTTKGKMSQLTATVGVLASEFKEKFDPYINKALGSAIEFAQGLVNIDKQGNVTLKTLGELAKDSVKWGESLNQGIQKAINGIKGFVTGGGLDNLLTIGTNIIQGICKGISAKAEDGTLKETFSSIIQKGCKFIGENSEAIGQAGRDILEALADAIMENEGIIKGAMDDLAGIILDWTKGEGKLQSVAGTFADSMIDAFVDRSIAKATGRGGEIWNAMFSVGTLEDGPNIKNGQGSGGLGSLLGKDASGKDNPLKKFDDFVGNMSKRAGEKLKEGAKWVGDGIKSWFLGDSYACEVATEGGKKIGTTTGDNIKVGLDEKGQPIVDSATKTGTESAEGIQSALESMDLQYLQALGQEMTNVGTLTGEMANSMSTSFTSIADSARTQFTNFSNIVKNQLTNATNAIRTGMLNSTNIVKNQATNMTNAVRTGFVNMSLIVSNQATNMANSLRTGFTNMTNIVTNQATNMANSIRTGFVNMANIVNNQATNMANTLRTSFTNMTNIAKNQATNMANAVKTSFTNMSNIAKTQFTNIANSIRTQMTNCANIVRNQMLNMTNIVKNQTTNMNNAVRTGFVNMANIVRNQMTNCTNIVRNQASNMSSAMSQGLSKMASSAQSAMSRVLSVIRSAMAQARAIASAPITINIKSNVQRKVTTTHVAGGLKQTMANIGANSLSVGTPNVMSAGPTHTVNPVSGNGANYVFTIPVSVDGREVARATAKYNQAELDRLSKRNARKRGE